MLEFGRERRRFSAAEYLALEERAGQRSEFLQGELYTLAGGSLDHNRIVNNISRWLGQKLEGSNCEVFTSDVRLRIEAHDLFTYPA